MGLTKTFVSLSAGQYNDERYKGNIWRGFDWLCRNMIRYVASELHENNTHQIILLVNYKGFIPIDKNSDWKGYLSCNATRRGPILL